MQLKETGAPIKQNHDSLLYIQKRQWNFTTFIKHICKRRKALKQDTSKSSTGTQRLE
jgi:hypothetical protein